MSMEFSTFFHEVCSIETRNILTEDLITRNSDQHGVEILEDDRVLQWLVQTELHCSENAQNNSLSILIDILNAVLEQKVHEWPQVFSIFFCQENLAFVIAQDLLHKSAEFVNDFDLNFLNLWGVFCRSGNQSDCLENGSEKMLNQLEWLLFDLSNVVDEQDQESF